MFLSGLEIGRLDDMPFHRQLLVDLVTGQLGDESLQEMMSRITRVVIAGNSLSDQTRDREAATRAKYLSKKTEAGTKDAVAALDDFLLQLAAGVEVDLMPGEFDPSSFALPQQPLHVTAGSPACHDALRHKSVRFLSRRRPRSWIIRSAGWRCCPVYFRTGRSP